MRILYKNGNMAEAWGIKFDHKEFDDAEVEAALADGWVMNPLELKLSEADTDGDGKLSSEEAKAYLDSIGVDYSGLHWKKVVALAQEKLDEQDKG
ncbi:MAG: hypothetical protein ACRC8G_08895 [Plesiomonas shigelloides]